MIRVLHYGMSPNLGGIETYLLNLASTADRQRFGMDFLYSDQGTRPVFANELTPLGSRFYGVTPRRASLRRNRRDLDSLFTHEQFDILHFHANTASYVDPVRAALRHGVRVVVHSHNAGTSRSRLTRSLHAWHRWTLPWDRITRVAVSSEAGRWMFGDRPFEVLHNGIDVDRFAFVPEARRAIRESLGIGADTFVVGNVAAFLPAKNHDFLLRVFIKVAERDQNARLLLVGAGPLQAQIRQQADDLGLGKRVIFLDRRSDVPELLAAMDVFLFPSLHEGFGLVALEAQASGLPCLLSDTITDEVIVSPSCQRLPLEIGPVKWAASILALAGKGRSPEGVQSIHAAGMSVAEMTHRVEELYESQFTAGQAHGTG